MFDTKSSSLLAASCGSWFSRDGVSMAAAPKQRCESSKGAGKMRATHWARCSDENVRAYLIFISLISGWCFHNVDICWNISMRCLLQDAWVMPDVQNYVPHSCTKWINRCIKSMPEMADAPDKVRTPEEKFLRISRLFKVIRSFDPPRCFSCHHC